MSSAETLRSVACQIREGNTSEFDAGYEDKFELAVAEWLDLVAVGWSLYEGRMRDVAIRAARAYLGGAA